VTELTPAASITTGKEKEYYRLPSGKVWFWCPGTYRSPCGSLTALGKLCTVGEDGRVDGAVSCGKCGWASRLVRLVGWEPPAGS
jgi:hypothetical protein